MSSEAALQKFFNVYKGKSLEGYTVSEDRLAPFFIDYLSIIA
tara:strand:+ start:76 stop:201 length:126 start_codon:yes stop_codon:yes gene_type:complete